MPTTPRQNPSSIRNSTEQKLSEERLRLLTRAIDQCPFSILIADAQARIEHVNPCFERITGYSAAEARGRNAGFIRSGEHTVGFYEELWNTISSGHEWAGEFHNRKKNGELHWERALIFPVRDEHGTITHFLSIKVDITERKREEAGRCEMASRLLITQNIELVGRLGAGIAHEINTPAQYISDNTNFLSDSFQQLARFFEATRNLRLRAATVPELAADATALAEVEQAVELEYLTREIPCALEQTLQGLGQIKRIVASLKEFSHPVGGKKGRANLNRTIETIVAVSRHEWKSVAELVVELDPNLPGVPCAEDEINQAVLHLIVNAAHAVEDANARLGRSLGRITIRTYTCADFAITEFEDTGTGILPENHQHIFQPFFTTKAIGKGSGLGLSIVRNIVVNGHRGQVDFTTELGKGSTFRIALPICQATNPAPPFSPSLK